MRPSTSSTIYKTRRPDLEERLFTGTPVQRRAAHWQLRSEDGILTPLEVWEKQPVMDYPEDVTRNSQVLMRFFPIMDPDPVTPSSKAGVEQV
ncbi:hypothetical protein CSUB01_02521 [Colletotrichum sublineola]|uniref:Uncharacterized protein n=1 Tax=Colletotrichum sublineola TaxID=1173701 RepID=A0A066XW71_COLSU|nr:hypothetical protein CSUB01_02521 [Colletotrichum sublineola]